MTELVQAVRAEHRQILDLVDQLEKEYEKLAVAGRKAIRRLVALESRHEVAEAQVLWPVVRDALREMNGVRAVAQGQEREARRLLHRLHKTMGTEEARSLVPKVIESIRLHVALEERHVLDPLGSTLSRNDSMSLGAMFERISAKSPTRPHPLTPAIPGVLAMTAPMARRADRIRDLLRLR